MVQQRKLLRKLSFQFLLHFGNYTIFVFVFCSYIIFVFVFVFLIRLLVPPSQYVEACVKTPEIPPWYLKLEYPCGLTWDQACWNQRFCVSYPNGAKCGAFYCKVRWRQVCTTTQICSPPYPSGVQYCNTNWKVFPGIPQVKRCQDAKVAEVEICSNLSAASALKALLCYNALLAVLSLIHI